jgi:hypothetical protein
MTEHERAILGKVVFEAVRFSLWAAGEGICPQRGENAESPEDFLFDYSNQMDIDDWDWLPFVAQLAILALPLAAPALSVQTGDAK